MAWAELWYNTTYHKALQTTLFKIVYGWDPPPILLFKSGSTTNFELEKALRERVEFLEVLKKTVARAHDIMKNQDDNSRKDVQLAVGDTVYLKLQPYRQKTMGHRFCQELAAKFYGPYRILERIGNLAYKLQLPSEARIHPVFHISQLKLALGQHEQCNVLPPGNITKADEPIVPENVLEKCFDAKGELELLVQ